METPLKNTKETKRKYTAAEKEQLLANLDIEVAHRTRQFEESLVQILENFRTHHEGQVLRVPKLVRNITMAEFADKYNGDINECLRGLQRERQGGEPALDPTMKKRKWKATEDTQGPDDAESSRAPKTARVVSSPAKMDASKIIKSRLNKTPLRSARHPHSSFAPSSPSKMSSLNRSTSPSKASSSRPPTSKDFNPLLPKTPAYPRALRRNESLMSVNGSPLANPFHHSHVHDTIDEEEEVQERPSRTIRRTQSIVVRRDPSFSFSTSLPPNGAHSRAPSQSSQPTNHARNHSKSHVQSSSTDSSSSYPSTSESLGLSQPTAFMRVPTKDGLLLEFDPLLTTPEELDALEGITDSAKKQAKEDMTRLVQAALSRWRI